MFYLKRNLLLWERGARIAAGLAAVFAAYLFLLQPWMSWAGMAAGVGFALTGLVGFCPLCALAGRRLPAKAP